MVVIENTLPKILSEIMEASGDFKKGRPLTACRSDSAPGGGSGPAPGGSGDAPHSSNDGADGNTTGGGGRHGDAADAHPGRSVGAGGPVEEVHLSMPARRHSWPKCLLSH